MGASALKTYEGPHREQMKEYLSSENGYWLGNDQWHLESEAFQKSGIKTVRRQKTGLLGDFSGYACSGMKLEIKYYLLYSMKENHVSTRSVLSNYTKSIAFIGKLLAAGGRYSSFSGLDTGDRELYGIPMTESEKRCYLSLKHSVTRFITEIYDDREEFEKDIWSAFRIPGAKISAAGKRQHTTLHFEGIPENYRDSVKRFMSRLVTRRSWSYCKELLLYIRYYYRAFYTNGYGDGFQEKLTRADVEKYLGWVASDYESDNATFRSKAVSFIRTYLDYIQLAEYPQSPQKELNRLLFDDDIPRRERATDTMGKVKYIPEPVRIQLDAVIQEIDPPEMLPVYVLLRETGWRGTDVLNLRYDSCLEHVWNRNEEKYITYLCSEITKTGIPLLKIPVRDEVADMVKGLAEEAVKLSTDGNNPEKYLFNTYEGRCKGLPYSKPAFSSAVQDLVNRKGIMDGDGKLHHFKAHSLRHTRALEYTEQGMPLGIIQQLLGHCSLQMTLHYAKISEDMLYKKWKETEKLELFHLDSAPPVPVKQGSGDIHYEFIRKNLDAVRIPFGVCFKPSKISCRQQMNPCFECAGFCSTKDNLEEYEAEIHCVEKQLEISRQQGRTEWAGKNQEYLDRLKAMSEAIRRNGVIHKNGAAREVCDG